MRDKWKLGAFAVIGCLVGGVIVFIAGLDRADVDVKVSQSQKQDVVECLEGDKEACRRVDESKGGGPPAGTPPSSPSGGRPQGPKPTPSTSGPTPKPGPDPPITPPGICTQRPLPAVCLDLP